MNLVQRRFDDWSSHQNWGVRNIRFKHPWVLYIDADERVEPELADELQRMAQPDSPAAAYTMRRRDYFLVPIDDCYALAGIVRTHWKGLTGGAEVWREIDAFFDRLREQAV